MVFYVWLVVCNSVFWVPSNCVFGCFDLAALLRLLHLKCLFITVSELKGAITSVLHSAVYTGQAVRKLHTFTTDYPVIAVMCLICLYSLPITRNGPIKAAATHKEPTKAPTAHSSSCPQLTQWLPPAHPRSLASQCMSGHPNSTCHVLSS